LQKSAESGFAAAHPLEVHGPDNCLGVFNPTQQWCQASLLNGLDQQPLEVVALTLLAGDLTALADRFLEGRRINEHPAFDVRFGNRIDYPFSDGLDNWIDLVFLIVIAAAVGIATDDQDSGCNGSA
jgi:hypothetical protein